MALKINFSVHALLVHIFGVLMVVLHTNEMLSGTGMSLESDAKILGALVKTRHTVLPPELRNYIASFAEPVSTTDCPIDFVAHSRIIPKECGIVCDMYRNSTTKKVKILTCRYGSPQEDMLRAVRSVAMWGSIASLMYLGMRDSLGIDMMPCDHGLTFQKAIGVGLAAWGSWTKDVVSLCLGRKNLIIPRLEALIIDGATMNIEGRFDVSTCFNDRPRNLYLLHNGNTVEVRTKQNRLKNFSKSTQSITWSETHVATDACSVIERASRDRQIAPLSACCNPHNVFDSSSCIEYWFGNMPRTPSGSLILHCTDQQKQALKHWSKKLVIPSPAGHPEVGFVEGYEKTMYRSFRLDHGGKTTLGLCDTNNRITLHRFFVDASNAKRLLSTMVLPSCTRHDAYALQKTHDSECVLLCIRDKTILVDFTRSISPQLKILLKNSIDLRIPLQIDYTKKHTYSFLVLSHKERQRIAENMRAFVFA